MKNTKLPMHISRPDLLRQQSPVILKEVDIKDKKAKFMPMGDEPKRPKK